MTRSRTMRTLAAVCTAGAVVLTGCAGSVAGGALSGQGSGCLLYTSDAADEQ